MGGPGSGRRPDKTCVSDCRVLSISELSAGARRQTHPTGEIVWVATRSGLTQACLCYTITEEHWPQGLHLAVLALRYWPTMTAAESRERVVLGGTGKPNLAYCPRAVNGRCASSTHRPTPSTSSAGAATSSSIAHDPNQTALPNSRPLWAPCSKASLQSTRSSSVPARHTDALPRQSSCRPWRRSGLWPRRSCASTVCAWARRGCRVERSPDLWVHRRAACSAASPPARLPSTWRPSSPSASSATASYGRNLSLAFRPAAAARPPRQTAGPVPHGRRGARGEGAPLDEQPGDELGGLLVLLGQDVRVDVHGERHGRVTQPTRDDARVDAGGKGQGGVGVTQVVQTDRW